MKERAAATCSRRAWHTRTKIQKYKGDYIRECLNDRKFIVISGITRKFRVSVISPVDGVLFGEGQYADALFAKFEQSI